MKFSQLVKPKQKMKQGDYFFFFKKKKNYIMSKQVTSTLVLIYFGRPRVRHKIRLLIQRYVKF